MLARRLPPLLPAAVLLAGCTSAPASSPAPTPDPTPSTTASPTPDAPDVGRYVALGDSYAAGPGIGRTDADSGFCLRSDSAWPSLVAERTSADLTDVTCSGDTTTNVLTPVTGAFGDRPAQLDAVTGDTDLVTVQIGGNDGGLFQSLISACVQQATTCQSYVGDTAPAVLTTTTASVSQVLDRVRAAAPDATVRLVGYPRIAPESGTCSALGIETATVDLVRTAEAELDAALVAAADRSDVTYVSMRSASIGHDACAGEDAWTNAGAVPDADGIAFHPRAAGMQAVADQVVQTL